jgi:hypothetical protein
MAGKSTLVSLLRAELGGSVTVRTVEIKEEVATWPVGLREWRFGPEDHCCSWVSGGSSSAWLPRLMSGVDRGVFLFDPQKDRAESQIDYWHVARELLPESAWTFVIGKQDRAPIAEAGRYLEMLGAPQRPVVCLNLLEIQDQSEWSCARRQELRQFFVAHVLGQVGAFAEAKPWWRMRIW